MKHITLLLAGILLASVVSAQPERHTELFAVRGADSLYLDHYRADGEAGAKRPCMIFVFGGGFAYGSRDAEMYVPYFEYMTSRGWDVVSIDYRLGMKNAAQASLASFVPMLVRTLEMATEDLYSATAHVIGRAGEWGIDPSRIVACGSSAGAITVLQGEYGICNGAAAAILPQGFNYAGVVSFAGAVFSMGDGLVWTTPPAPIMLFHGDADSNVPYGALTMDGAGVFGSEIIAASLRAADSPYWFYSVENARHEMAELPMNGNRAEIDEFLHRFVESREPLMITTDVVRIGAPVLDKELTIADFIRANYGGN